MNPSDSNHFANEVQGYIKRNMARYISPCFLLARLENLMCNDFDKIYGPKDLFTKKLSTVLFKN